MLAELIAKRRMTKLFEAFEDKDIEGLLSFWDDDVVLEFPAGLPMAGEWHGRDAVRALFEEVFAHNSSLQITLHHVAILHPSPTGRARVYCEWSAVETGIDGDVVQTDVLSVAETRRWRAVRSTDYFSNVPGLAAHYATMPLPSRRASTTMSRA